MSATTKLHTGWKSGDTKIVWLILLQHHPLTASALGRAQHRIVFQRKRTLTHLIKLNCDFTWWHRERKCSKHRQFARQLRGACTHRKYKVQHTGSRYIRLQEKAANKKSVRETPQKVRKRRPFGRKLIKRYLKRYLKWVMQVHCASVPR